MRYLYRYTIPGDTYSPILLTCDGLETLECAMHKADGLSDGSSYFCWRLIGSSYGYRTHALTSILIFPNFVCGSVRVSLRKAFSSRGGAGGYVHNRGTIWLGDKIHKLFMISIG